MQAEFLDTPELTVLVIVGLAVLLLAGFCVRSLKRRRRPEPGIPVLDWEQRARSAEARALQAEGVVKGGLFPHLARLLRAKLVVRLIRQRAELIEAQTEGTDRMIELEQRLATTQVAVQEKLATLEAPPRNESSEEATAGEPGVAKGSARANPLLKRPARPEPEPLQIREVMARRKARAEETPPPAPPSVD